MAKDAEEVEEGKSLTCVLGGRVKYCLEGGNLPKDLCPDRFWKSCCWMGDSTIARCMYFMEYLLEPTVCQAHTGSVG